MGWLNDVGAEYRVMDESGISGDRMVDLCFNCWRRVCVGVAWTKADPVHSAKG